jgi:hypothetical protein
MITIKNLSITTLSDDGIALYTLYKCPSDKQAKMVFFDPNNTGFITGWLLNDDIINDTANVFDKMNSDSGFLLGPDSSIKFTTQFDSEIVKIIFTVVEQDI